MPCFLNGRPMIEPKCDFCSERPVVWSYHVMPLPINMGVDSAGRQHVTNSEWAACANCKKLVDKGSRLLLLERSTATHPLRAMWQSNPGLQRDVRREIARFHEDFFRVKYGPGDPYSTTVNEEES